jgi:hypothetical protein
MNPDDFEQTYEPLLSRMIRPKKHLTAVPTFVPQSAFDQWQLYDDGVNRRLYVYVNGTWRYTALT